MTASPMPRRATAGGVGHLGSRAVARVGLGAMQLPRLDLRSAVALLRRAVDLGVNHIDTAAYYGSETANNFIRSALHPYPADLVIVSKVGYRRSDRGGLIAAQRPEELRAGIEAEIRSLGVERLDIVNLRLEEPESRLRGAVDFEDQLAEMIAMRDAGLIGSYGVSNVGFDLLSRALDAGAICCQNAYSLINRTDEPLLEMCTRRGIAWVPYFPLGSGVLGQRSTAAGRALTAISERLGATAAQISLAWLLAHAPNVLLIPGTASIEHLQENVLSAAVRLDSDQLRLLDQLA
jgi:pyridoxine 4-dehydrogenase